MKKSCHSKKVIESLSPKNEQEMILFLEKHHHYSLFLLGNYKSYGSRLGEAPYSGNYKLIRAGNEVVAVFCLTKKGSLLIQSEVGEPIFESVLEACLEEKIAITGLVGDWEFCHLFWQFLKTKKIIQIETFLSKEILYVVDLSNVLTTESTNVRLLEKNDFSQWKPLRIAYINETGFPNELTEEQLLEIFIDKCNKKIIWGFFQDNKLVSVADLNAKAGSRGQLGGVYTVPQSRKKGYSKAVISKLFIDLKSLHHMHTLIIFTGEKNFPAQKLYESLGVTKVGHFALLFGK